MKILVVDDKMTHRKAADAQLGDEHELTLARSYDEGREALTSLTDYDRVQELVRERGLERPGREASDEEQKKWRAGYNQACADATTHPDFDVVLVDLLMPASRESQGDKGMRYVGQEMPIGVFLAILAAARTGAKFVGLLTDSDHHSHPASACLDEIQQSERSPKSFKIEDAKVLLCNTRAWVNLFAQDDLSTPLDDTTESWRENKDRQDVVNAKNWVKLLAHLLDDSSEEEVE